MWKVSAWGLLKRSQSLICWMYERRKWCELVISFVIFMSSSYLSTRRRQSGGAARHMMLLFDNWTLRSYNLMTQKQPCKNEKTEIIFPFRIYYSFYLPICWTDVKLLSKLFISTMKWQWLNVLKHFRGNVDLLVTHHSVYWKSHWSYCIVLYVFVHLQVHLYSFLIQRSVKALHKQKILINTLKHTRNGLKNVVLMTDVSLRPDMRHQC